MTVKAFRLLSGEDIISEVVNETVDTVALKTPAAIVVQQTADGRVGASFAPFMPFAKDGKVTLKVTAIVGEFDIDVKLQNEYSRIFGSGIVLATEADVPRIQQ